MAINYLILLSRQGKVRLAKWFTTLSPKEKAKIIKDVSQLVLARRTRMCNFLEYKGLLAHPCPPPPKSTNIHFVPQTPKLSTAAMRLIHKLGLAEFSAARLTKFVPKTRVKPGVDQINVRDCCIVPNALIKLAKREGIELLTHNDCSNILPRGTVRELLGPSAPASLSPSGAPASTNANGDGSINGHSALSADLGGAGILAPDSRTGEKRKMHPASDVEDTRANGEHETEGLKGEVEPQWVIKYTAVVRNRGVVENKGYFAEAELKDAL
ncbi:hypothetical protein B0A49_08447 [Cryomyces minteri]|uniref:AP complex mu/sigma subunit domain-containing protein n=1 Tax=Cryomyces minteri TaxID=331657 RepID=A0A4V5NG83_9PEZI|nr:hypothetical protein B0A49_08447 [Cryomyces minteri]